MKTTFMKVPAATAPATRVERARPLDLAEVHATHADFVWRSLARLGIRDRDLPDMLQEVFVIVHRRASSYDGSSKLTSWLFGICLRVASSHRRRAHVRREELVESVPEAQPETSLDPEAALQAKQARARLAAVLDAMPLDKRAIFVMFEIDAMSCAEIAAVLDVPLGTVHSRLSAARQAFEAALRRIRARERSLP
jgi:RNA polymerase sigma-70 factor (ECF subfamily)